ncbi:MAG TPA: HD-GYP domain-containing protein [Candidatus Dormibacteraeota bacterium]
MAPQRLRIYVGAVSTAAAASGAAALLLAPPNADQFALAALLILLATGATQFPLLVTPRVKVNTSSAAYFAAALILVPGAAVAVAATTQLAGGLLLMRRRNPLTGRPRRQALDTLFNAAAWSLAAVAASATFHAIAGSSAGRDREGAWFLAAAAAALVMYGINTLLVSGAASLQTGAGLLGIWLNGRRVDAATEAGLYVIGAIAAVAAPEHPWVLVGLIIPTALLHSSLQHALQVHRETVSAVERMADLVDIRDGYTGQHSERVADLAESIARRLHLPAEEVTAIRLAARVHDIGKIAIPDRVLHKPGPLDAEEWALMQDHVEAGCRVLERFSDYEAGLELVRCHHERLDGSGYPRRLAGPQVPLGAQVIGVADSIDAMTSDRPYRAAMPRSAVIAELRWSASRTFSTEVVASALATLGAGGAPPQVERGEREAERVKPPTTGAAAGRPPRTPASGRPSSAEQPTTVGA